jgi:hypothetical protein
VADTFTQPTDRSAEPAGSSGAAASADSPRDDQAPDDQYSEYSPSPIRRSPSRRHHQHRRGRAGGHSGRGGSHHHRGHSCSGGRHRRGRSFSGGRHQRSRSGGRRRHSAGGHRPGGNQARSPFSVQRGRSTTPRPAKRARSPSQAAATPAVAIQKRLFRRDRGWQPAGGNMGRTPEAIARRFAKGKACLAKKHAERRGITTIILIICVCVFEASLVSLIMYGID